MQDNQENRIKFASLLGKLCVAFRVDSNSEMINVYFEFLSDRSMYQIENAIIDIIKNGERFPTVSAIRNAAGSYREFKTVEANTNIAIEQFSSLETKYESAEDFFKEVNGMFGGVK